MNITCKFNIGGEITLIKFFRILSILIIYLTICLSLSGKTADKSQLNNLTFNQVEKSYRSGNLPDDPELRRNYLLRIGIELNNRESKVISFVTEFQERIATELILLSLMEFAYPKGTFLQDYFGKNKLLDSDFKTKGLTFTYLSLLNAGFFQDPEEFRDPREEGLSYLREQYLKIFQIPEVKNVYDIPKLSEFQLEDDESESIDENKNREKIEENNKRWKLWIEEIKHQEKDDSSFLKDTAEDNRLELERKSEVKRQIFNIISKYNLNSLAPYLNSIRGKFFGYLLYAYFLNPYSENQNFSFNMFKAFVLGNRLIFENAEFLDAIKNDGERGLTFSDEELESIFKITFKEYAQLYLPEKIEFDKFNVKNFQWIESMEKKIGSTIMFETLKSYLLNQSIEKEMLLSKSERNLKQKKKNRNSKNNSSVKTVDDEIQKMKVEENSVNNQFSYEDLPVNEFDVRVLSWVFQRGSEELKRSFLRWLLIENPKKKWITSNIFPDLKSVENMDLTPQTGGLYILLRTEILKYLKKLTSEGDFGLIYKLSTPEFKNFWQVDFDNKNIKEVAHTHQTRITYKSNDLFDFMVREVKDFILHHNNILIEGSFNEVFNGGKRVNSRIISLDANEKWYIQSNRFLELLEDRVEINHEDKESGIATDDELRLISFRILDSISKKMETGERQIENAWSILRQVFDSNGGRLRNIPLDKSFLNTSASDSKGLNLEGYVIEYLLHIIQLESHKSLELNLKTKVINFNYQDFLTVLSVYLKNKTIPSMENSKFDLLNQFSVSRSRRVLSYNDRVNRMSQAIFKIAGVEYDGKKVLEVHLDNNSNSNRVNGITPFSLNIEFGLSTPREEKEERENQIKEKTVLPVLTEFDLVFSAFERGLTLKDVIDVSYRMPKSDSETVGHEDLILHGSTKKDFQFGKEDFVVVKTHKWIIEINIVSHEMTIREREYGNLNRELYHWRGKIKSEIIEKKSPSTKSKIIRLFPGDFYVASAFSHYKALLSLNQGPLPEGTIWTGNNYIENISKLEPKVPKSLKQILFDWGKKGSGLTIFPNPKALKNRNLFYCRSLFKN